MHASNDLRHRLGSSFRLLKILRVLFSERIDELLPQPKRGALKALAWCIPTIRMKRSRGERLRDALQTLGPVFVKFGQMLSTRRDLLPPDIATPLAELQDQVKPFAGATAKAIIESDLECTIDAIFSEFSAEPMASASVAQVHSARLKSQTILNLINKTKFAISNEETRYFLNGLYFNISSNAKTSKLTFVGTDGHRLATSSSILNTSIDEIPGVIIPKKTINELSKLLSENYENIEIEISSNKIIFYIDQLILISKLIDGNFPDYTRVIPKNNINDLKINRENLLSAVDRVSTIANEKSPSIKFKLLENLINLSSVNNENSTATEDIQANYDGNEIEIGFNSRYVMDILDNLEGKEIKISFNDNSNPIMIQEKIDSENIYVLMPMRV